MALSAIIWITHEFTKVFDRLLTQLKKSPTPMSPATHRPTNQVENHV